MSIVSNRDQSTYVKEWQKLTENVPFILIKEELPELSLACLIVLGELDNHVQGGLQFKGTDDRFCEGIPAGGNRANKHFRLDWGF